jgi:TatD DNase family protein
VTTATFIDSHCHLDQLSDPIAAARAAAQAGIVVVAVTETPARYQAAARLFAGRSNVRVALGLHPLRASRSSKLDVRTFIELMPNVDYIGEVGLDYSPAGRASRTAQIQVLDEILGAAAAPLKVWSFHARRAESDVIAKVETMNVPGILHWYTGPTALVERACAAGLFFSVNLAMLSSASGSKTVAALPRDRVLTETDAPFVRAPGARGDATDVSRVVDGLARTWRVPRDEAAGIVFANMAAVYARAKASQGAA